MSLRVVRILSCLLIVSCLLARSSRGADDPGLAAARQEYAEHYFSAEAHLRLASYLAEHGQKLTGFFVSESARRSQFDEKAFAQAVQAVYHHDDFQNGPEAEEALLREVKSHPNDAKKHERLADLYLSRSEWKKAEAELRRAIALDPESFDFVDVLGEVLRRDHREAEGAALEGSWLKAHPKSLPAYTKKIESLSKSGHAAARATTLDALEAYPENAQLHYTYAAFLHEDGSLPEAAAEFEKAASLAPHSAFIQGWTGRFFLKVMKDPEKSLHYYLNAYFIDPDFYDSEYAEGRIRTLGTELGPKRYQAERAAGKSALQLLESGDPYVAGLALQEAAKSWSPEVQRRVVGLLHHDDDSLRYGAATLLGENVDAAFDDELRQLLRSPDLRIRGASAYIAGARWKENVVPILKPWLDEKAELILYEAVSVLSESGGEPGKAALREYRDSASVKPPRLAAILQTIDQPRAKDQ
jgi:tetratricopeptide (TPR) repeat protein